MNQIQVKKGQLNPQHILSFLKRDEADGTLNIEKNRCSKAINFKGNATRLKLEFLNDSIKFENNKDLNLEEQTQFLNHWLDLEHDLSDFYTHLLTVDNGSKLLEMCKGFRLISLPTLFEALSWSIIGQQINIKFAIELKRRFIQSFGLKIENLYCYPTPDDLKKLKESDLIDLRFGKFKSRYIMNVLDFLNTEDTSRFHELNNVALYNKLTSIKGIGEWSAQYVMLKYYHRYDIFPRKDVGLHNAIAYLNNQKNKPDSNSLDRHINEYGKYSGYIAQYLYLSLQYRS